ncbi:MAG TPA: ribbon-helix-helix domain-containing protein [Dongiaceae bacterium]|nr:ribbon-helix-helix domain-containing protein [Dongiaceae bacterium]
MTIAGHRTSISLEEEFWVGLARMAAERGVSLAALIAAIDGTRRTGNLASALRIAVLQASSGAEPPDGGDGSRD